MKSEDLRLNIIVNGDAGRKEILDTEKAISKLESELKSLKNAEGDHSKEIAETNKKLISGGNCNRNGSDCALYCKKENRLSVQR